RGAAIGTWSAFSAMTAAVGPVAGGYVVTHASWRWLFLFNVPIAVVILVLARGRVAETRDESAPEKMDWLGASLATVGLGLIVYGLVDSARQAGTVRLLTFVGIGVVILIAFVAVEARCPSPMVPLSLFASRSFSGANLLTLFLYAALGGALFFVPFNLIQVQGYTPAEAGASLLPFVVLVSAMSRWAGGLVGRLGARLPLVGGPLLASLGFALFALPGTGGRYSSPSRRSASCCFRASTPSSIASSPRWRSVRRCAVPSTRKEASSAGQISPPSVPNPTRPYGAPSPTRTSPASAP
ncbi:MAG: MFS transporter, partial [Polyangiaceae bacterium]